MTRKSKKSSSRSKHSKLKLFLLALAVVGWLFARMPSGKRKKIIRASEKKAQRVFEKLVDFFIPHERNGYKPHVFQHRAVKHILLLIILIKVGVVSVLFTLYPNLALLNQDIRAEMYRLINEHRAETGIPTLKVNEYLEQVALSKGRDMVEKKYFSHFGLDGKKPWQWFDRSVYDFGAMGENLAMDFLTARAVESAFEQSPTHERNLVHTAYSEVGIAIVNGYLDRHNTNLMVVMFARPKEKPAVVVAQKEPVRESPPTLAQSKKPTPDKKPAQPLLPNSTPTTSVSGLALKGQNRATTTAPVSQDTAQINQTDVLGEATVETKIYTDNMTGGAVFAAGSFWQRIIAWADRILLALLLTLVLLLIVNIFVKIRIQHRSIIANAVFLILIASAALFVHLHRAEAIGEKVRILAQLLL